MALAADQQNLANIEELTETPKAPARSRPPRALRIPATVSPLQRTRSLSPTPESPVGTEQETIVPDTIQSQTPTPTVDITQTTSKGSTNPPTPSVTTDDSDTEFQSAYSTSPRVSYGSFDEERSRIATPEPVKNGELSIPTRERSLSNSTAKVQNDHDSLLGSDTTARMILTPRASKLSRD